MNKQELINAIAERTGETKKSIDAILGAFADTVTHELKSGSEVTLTGVGVFKTSQRAARVGRNPQTGEPANIAAALVPKFKASLVLKKALNG